MAQALLSAPSRPAINQTKLLIDGRWVDAAEGGDVSRLTTPPPAKPLPTSLQAPPPTSIRPSSPPVAPSNPAPGAAWTPPNAAT